MSATILHIETSTTACSVAVATDGNLVALREQNSGSYTHAENLHVFIEELLHEKSIAYTDLAAVAVSSGPGSYTGLRIGASAAKGFCFALDIPLIAVNSLHAMANQVAMEIGDQSALYLPMIDARRMEVFTMGVEGSGKVVFPTRAEVISPESFSESDKYAKVYYFGDGADKCSEILSAAPFSMVPNKCTSAAYMVELAFNAFQQSNFVNTAYFEPFYLKEFIAGKPKKLL